MWGEWVAADGRCLLADVQSHPSLACARAALSFGRRKRKPSPIIGEENSKGRVAENQRHGTPSSVDFTKSHLSLMTREGSDIPDKMGGEGAIVNTR